MPQKKRYVFLQEQQGTVKPQAVCANCGAKLFKQVTSDGKRILVCSVEASVVGEWPDEDTFKKCFPGVHFENG